jgi:hypothetical protein
MNSKNQDGTSDGLASQQGPPAAPAGQRDTASKDVDTDVEFKVKCSGGFPSIKMLLQMSPRDDRHSALVLFLMLAQAYYALVEAAVSNTSKGMMVDFDLNHYYLYTIQGLAYLLKHCSHLEDFPTTFEPVLPDLYPSRIADLEWEGVIALQVEEFTASAQRYVTHEGTFEQDEPSPMQRVLELFRPSLLAALACADDYKERMYVAQDEALGRSRQPQNTQQSPTMALTKRFPTPKGATWSDVKMNFVDGETLSIRVGEQTGRSIYSEMGMIDGRNKRPTKQWEFLRALATHKGYLTWDSPAADRKQKKRREVLSENLKAFFGIEGDPIELTEDRKGWRTVFSISDD